MDHTLHRVSSLDETSHGPPRILMTHSATINIPPSADATSSAPNGNLQRRTAEGVLQLRNNLNNVIQGFQPLVDSARSINVGGRLSISNLLNGSAQSEPNIPASVPNSVVINLGNYANGIEHAQNNPPTNNQNEGETENNENNPNNEIAQTRLRVSSFPQYIPFIIILLLKAVYDHHEGILNFIVLLTAFSHANFVVKSEATKKTRRNLSKLFLALLYSAACILFVCFIFEEDHFLLNLIFINHFETPLTLSDLIWIVGLTDFILKLMTVILKICLTLLPGKIIAFQRRGKIYLFIEAISQLYRSLTPIKPWIFYLLESYQGTEKFLGVFLSTVYMVSKGGDLGSKIKLLRTAVNKLIQNVMVGTVPTNEEIQAAGKLCPICHDDYESPVLLECKHIFCEGCVTTWFDREQTCPMCRAKIVDYPAWQDGSTTFFIQLF